MASSPLFGIVPAGHQLITAPTSTPSPTSILYSLPTHKPFSHVVVFMLPGITLPENTAAAIYLTTTSDVVAAEQAGRAPNFKFRGGIGPGKESAMFKVDGAVEGLVMGVDVESAEVVGRQMEELAASKSQSQGQGQGSGGSTQPPTALLAQRIIQNAFNFLAGFSGQAGPGGVEVVPLKAFENWWRKFESRVRADPSFLERQAD